MHVITKRSLSTIPLLIGITFLSFVVMQLAPGDPTSIFMDPNMSASDVIQIKKNLGLDKPLPVQYFYWLKNVLKGDLGFSYNTGKPVLVAIGERLPATLLLSFASLILIVVITLPLGLISGAKKGSRFDNWVTFWTFVGLAMPTFWMGLIFILIFSLKLNLFPTSGYLDYHLMDANIFQRGLNIAYHMTLPLMTTVLGSLASLTRYHRFGIITILTQDYIKAARARGLSERRVLFKHAFKNAALPLVTILGLSIPSLIGGSFIIEYIFAWPGMGQLGIQAIFARDYPILMGTLLFSSILIIFGNLLSDVLYSYVDPRISQS